jgi:N-acetylglucosaminyldiphosphoundecaprenol N-acetyl-beta-D-mannosaminyltransferase
MVRSEGSLKMMTCWLFGIRHSMIDTRQAVELIMDRPATQAFAYVATPNAVHVVNVNRREGAYIMGLRDAWLVCCDSRVVRALGRRLAGRRLPLAPGSDLTAALFEHAIRPDDAVTVIGGDAALADSLRLRFGLRQLHLHAPPYGFIEDEGEIDRCIAFVRDHPARFVFIACGAPRSELLAARIRATGCAVGVGLCVGASLLFVTGRVARAPHVMQRLGLEWLHRLILEPRRLGRRLWSDQLPLIPIAIGYLLNPAKRSGHRLPPLRGLDHGEG